MENTGKQPGDFTQGASYSVMETARPSTSKSYARWNPDATRAFIEVCEIAIAKGYRNGQYFTKHGWERVVTLFISFTGHNWTKWQLHNYWDAMRQIYSGIEYNDVTDRMIASDEWWNQKIKENKDNKDFKDKNVSEIYIKYSQLFGDSYDGNKYAVTLTKLCRTGFILLEDCALEDNRDAISVNEKSSGSSNEAKKTRVRVGVNISNNTSGGKRKSSSGQHRRRKEKMYARELSYSVDHATNAVEEVAVKINTMMASNDNVDVDCVEELLATGRLERRTPLYFLTCALLTQNWYRDMLVVMKDADEKFEWIERMLNNRGK